MKTEITNIIKDLSDNELFIAKLSKKYEDKYSFINNQKIKDDINQIYSSWDNVNVSMNNISDTLDKASIWS